MKRRSELTDVGQIVQSSGFRSHPLVPSCLGIRHYGAPHFLPGGKVFLAERMMSDGPQLVSVRLTDGTVTELGIAGLAPHYVNGGWLVYVDRNGAAFAVPFDASRVRARGSPIRIAELPDADRLVSVVPGGRHVAGPQPNNGCSWQPGRLARCRSLLLNGLQLTLVR